MVLRTVFAGIFSSYVYFSGATAVSGEFVDQSPATSSAASASSTTLFLARQSSDLSPPALVTTQSSPITTQPSAQTTAQTQPQTTTPALHDVLTKSAVAYGAFQNDVSSIKQNLESNADIENAMSTLGSHNHEKLASGWLSYSALLASESEAFQKGVKDTADYHGRDRLMLGMQNSPAYTLSLKGADDAMSRALGASKADGRRLDRIGENIKAQAYSLQSLGWAKAKLKGQPSDHAQTLRLAALNGRPQPMEMQTLFEGPQLDEVITSVTQLGSMTSFWDRVSTTGPGFRLPTLSTIQSPTFSNAYAVKSQRRNSAGNIATLAALRILGETGTETNYVSSALNDAQTQSCFEEAHMNLLQCVSASRNVYERPFCIGVHALKEVGSCLSDVTY